MGPAPTPSAQGPDRSRASRLPRLLVLLLAADALGVLVIWTISLRRGAFADGAFAYQLEGTVPFFHLLAEVGMAVVALVGAAAWLAGARWSVPVLTFAAGMLSYGAVNAFGWAIHNDPAMVLPMGLTLLLAVWLLAHRVRGRDAAS